MIIPLQDYKFFNKGWIKLQLKFEELRWAKQALLYKQNEIDNNTDCESNQVSSSSHFF